MMQEGALLSSLALALCTVSLFTSPAMTEGAFEQCHPCRPRSGQLPLEADNVPATRLTQPHWRRALQALAAEVVSLEERCLHLRSSELRAAREAEGAVEVQHRSEHRSLMTAQEVASLEATIQALRVGMPAPGSSTEAACVKCCKKAAADVVCTSRAQQTAPRVQMQAQPQQLEDRPGQCHCSRCQEGTSLEATAAVPPPGLAG